MASHSKADVLATISREGVVPVFYNADIGVTKEVATAPGRRRHLDHRVHQSRRRCRAGVRRAHRLGPAELPELVVGVGTVTQAPTAGHVIDIGANFVFAPNLDRPTWPRPATSATSPTCPAAARSPRSRRPTSWAATWSSSSPPTPSAALRTSRPCAHHAPGCRAVPTGGVEPTVESLKAWYDAGAPAVGMGSKLLTKDLIAGSDWDGLEQKVADTVAAVAAARSKE